MLTIRRKLTLRLGAGALAVGAAAAALVLLPRPAAGSSAFAPPAAPRPLPVEVAPVRFEPGFERVERYAGTVEARRTTELGFERAGRVVEVRVDEGDQVAAGQVVALLERDGLLALEAELAARRGREAAVLAELEAGPRRETIDAARARLANLTEQLELARRVRARRAELVAADSASVEVLDQAETSERSLAAAVDEARAVLAELEAGTRAERLAAQRAALVEVDAALERVAADLADAELVAPYDGVVVARRVDEGAVVEPGDPVLRLVESAPLEARVGLPVDAAAELAVGDELAALLGARRTTARVVALPPEVEAGTRTRTVRVRLAGDAPTAPGATLELELVRRQELRGAWLPLAALTSSVRGTWSCFVVTEDGGAERVERAALELLHHAGERVFVRGTLRDGDRVVVSGAHRVVARQAVEARVVDADQQR